MKPRVLVVEDEAGIQEYFQDGLGEEFILEQVATVGAARERLRTFVPDIVLLDIRLPDGSGLDLCAEIRTTPGLAVTRVIMITGHGDSQSVVTAFTNGADDYVTKPFRMAEVVARLKSQIRRLREAGPVGNSFGNLRLNPEQLKARIGSREVQFSTLEYSLLSFFIKNGDKIASRKSILKKVWEGTVVSDRAVDAHIVSLRKKLEGFNYEIATVYGAGYMLRRRDEASRTEPAVEVPTLAP